MTAADYRARTFRSLGALYGAMFVGQGVFLIVSVGLIRLGYAPGFAALHVQLQWVVPIMIFAVVLLGTWVSGRRYVRAQARQLITLKLQAYQTGLVTNLAMLNGAAFFAVLTYLLTGEVAYLLLYGAVLVLYVRQRPSPAHARRVLQLSPDELPDAG